MYATTTTHEGYVTDICIIIYTLTRQNRLQVWKLDWPIAAGIELFVLALVQVNVGHLFPGLDKVRLLRWDGSQHAKSFVDSSAGQRQIHVCYRQSDFFAGALKVIDCVLHHLGCFMLKRNTTVTVITVTCGVAQWLERRSLTGELSLI